MKWPTLQTAGASGVTPQTHSSHQHIPWREGQADVNPWFYSPVVSLHLTAFFTMAEMLGMKSWHVASHRRWLVSQYVRLFISGSALCLTSVVSIRKGEVQTLFIVANCSNRFSYILHFGLLIRRTIISALLLLSFLFFPLPSQFYSTPR